jgi:aspartyl-tRNA(Asn)/glutamyl-tRNA(Gln) amidotransferase subunit B
MQDRFEAIIGLEIHAQTKTASKMFCACSSDSFNKEPNINTCPVCMGFPGQLPVINREAFRKGLKAALALHAEIPAFSKFDRKNYFYPDLPKGFQISQYDQPISKNGWLEIDLNGQKKRIRITRLHLEDDAGKLTHIPDGTLCDFNRSGIALMEIVSEPDLRSSKEASAYARTIQTILRFSGSSDADMEKGMMRFDASVSIRPKGEEKLYPRAEIKNLNSFRSLESAIDYEIERQIFLWDEGKPLSGDITVGWSDDHQKTYFLREKEGADDYRYFPEPDLPPLVISPEIIEELQKELPELPTEKNERYQNEWKISEAEALLISSDLKLAQYFEETVSVSKDPKKAASFLTSILLGRIHKDDITFDEIKITPPMLGKLIQLVNDGKISMNIAKTEIFETMYNEGKDPEVVIKEKGLTQMNDESVLEKICQQIIDANPKSASDFKSGKAAALQFLIGQVMKQTRGQAPANLVQEILNKLLS